MKKDKREEWEKIRDFLIKKLESCETIDDLIVQMLTIHKTVDWVAEGRIPKKVIE